MIFVRGRVVSGVKHFQQRMNGFPEVFFKATGEKLYPGTLNVRIDREIGVKEHFRIRGTEIGEPEQDLLFEVCRINGIWAYRIRPFHIKTGSGGHGDHTLEIACSLNIPEVDLGVEVEIAMFGEESERVTKT